MNNGSLSWSAVVLNIVISAFFLSLAGLLGFWAADRDPPTDVETVEADPQTVAPGQLLRLRYLLNRKRSCRVHLEQVMYDSENTRFTVGDEDYTTAPGRVGTDLFALQFEVPVHAMEGPAYYRGIRTYYCNPIHFWFHWPIVIVTKDVRFEIKNTHAPQ